MQIEIRNNEGLSTSIRTYNKEIIDMDHMVNIFTKTGYY